MFKVLLSISVLIFALACADLHIVEDSSQRAEAEAEAGAAVAALGSLGFKGGVKNEADKNYSSALSIFPDEHIYLGFEVSAPSSVKSAAYIFSDNISNEKVKEGSLAASDLNNLSQVLIDTSGLVPGVYKLEVSARDANGRTLTDHIIVTIMPKVVIQAIRKTTGNLLVDLYYPYGVGDSQVSINGTDIGTSPYTALDKKQAFTLEDVVLPPKSGDGDELVVTVSMNNVSGPDAKAILGNKKPFYSDQKPIEFDSCVLQSSDFSSSSTMLSSTTSKSHPVNNWRWSSSTMVDEVPNSAPSTITFGSSSAAENKKFSGQWKTTSSDDDYMGFVFGYQDAKSYYLFDWKKADQVWGTASGKKGFRIRKVDVNTLGQLPAEANFWDSVDKGGITTLVSKPSTGWEINKIYDFVVEQSKDKASVTINDAGDAVVSLEIPLNAPGKMGLYSFSQPNNIFSNMHTCAKDSDVSFVHSAKAVDPDGDSLTYSLISSPSGMTIDADTGEIKWSLPVDGSHELQVKAVDGRGGEVVQTISLIVK